MTTERGKLYKSTTIDLDKDYAPDIIESLNMAKKELKRIKTIDQLNAWAIKWFGE
ncbi:MAG: hypothetical protein ABSA11_12945 [Candidatus Bathyarchaeia archaeon]|jgi:hypothetical protein